MNSFPRSLSQPEDFPYKGEVIEALQAGVQYRKGEELYQASALIGTYKIRLRIAQDPETRGGPVDSDDQATRDLRSLVENLGTAPDSKIAVYFVGPTADRIKFTLFEVEENWQLHRLFPGRSRHN